MIKVIVVFWDTCVEVSYDDRLIMNASGISALALFDDKLTVMLSNGQNRRFAQDENVLFSRMPNILLIS